MSPITKIECYRLICDTCGEHMDWDYEPYFDTVEQAAEAASDSSWKLDDGKVECESCWEIKQMSSAGAGVDY